MCRQMAHKAPVYRERILFTLLKIFAKLAKKQHVGPHGQFWLRQKIVVAVAEGAG